MQTDDGETPLITAVGHGHFSTSALLLEHRADVNKQDKVRLLFMCPWSYVRVCQRIVCSV